MSTTYAANDEPSNRRVALKQLQLWHQHDWKVLELFEREASTLASLAHPNIPRYLHHFTTEGADGPSFYIAQEIAAGSNLAALSAAGQRPAEPGVREICDRLLEVLEYLQSRSPPIIHRDIKPENVILDGNNRPHLVDFGAVRDTYRSTVHGSTIVGTFGYMAPEQFYGKAVPATDVYGVAATAVFLLTGLGPDQLPRRRGRPDFRKRVRASSGFSAWLDRALSPEIADRFPTASAARDALAKADREIARSMLRVGLATALLAFLVVPLAAAAQLFWSGRTHRAPGSTPVSTGNSTRVEAPATWPRVRSGRLEYVQRLVGHYGGITDIQFHPDGHRAVTAAADGSVKLWTFQTGRLLRTFDLPEKRRVFNCALSGDGKLVAAAVPSVVRVWNLETGEIVREVRAKAGGSSFVALSPDGTVLAFGRLNGGVEVHFSAETAPLVLAQPKNVLSVAISPDGKRIAAAGEPTIRVWKLPSGQDEVTFRGSDRDVSEIAFSPNGNVLASAADDKTLRVFGLTPPETYRTIRGFDDEVWSVAIGSDNKTLVGGSKDGVVNIYDFISQELIETVKTPMPKIVAVAISPDVRYVATGSAEGGAMIFALRQPPWTPPPVDAPVTLAGRAFPEDASQKELLCLRGEALIDDTEGAAPAREARVLFEKALALDGSYSPAYAGLARVEYTLGFIKSREYDPPSLQRAHAAADKALELDPKSALAHVRKGYAFLFQRDFAKARAEAAKARSLEPKSWRLKTLEMTLAEYEGRYDEALLHARSVFESTDDPRVRRRIYASLTGIYNKLHEWDAAERTYLSCMNLEPASAWTRGNFANFLISRERYDEAIKWGREAIKIRDYPNAHYQVARASAMKAAKLIETKPDARQQALAERLLDEAYSESPNTAEELYGRALLALARGKRDSARELVRKALAHKDGFVPAQELAKRLE
ncbi:MAG: protein kinase [Myxococcales bacterium]|nr:protein kinase [Myxococcales bacterium]